MNTSQAKTPAAQAGLPVAFSISTLALALASLGSFASPEASAQDWPQWRGAQRDAHAAGFKAPKAWPKELTQQWKVTVGEGVAGPSIVGDRVYVFSRQDGYEVLRCLSTTDGKELWQDKYESLGATGPAQSFSGPRSSPAVGQGKVVTLGVRGMLSSVDAATGKVLWRKDEFQAYPNFHPSSSPMILGNLAIAQLGGRENGALIAYDLTSGETRWKWNGPSPSYASPALVTVGSTQLILAQTESKLIAVNAKDGSLAWESAEAPRPGGPGGPPGGGGGRGMGGPREYRASSPVVDGTTVIMAGRTVKAYQFALEGNTVKVRETWTNEEKGVQFNTPTLKDGRLYGLAGNNELFCLDAKDGRTLWSAPFPGAAAPGGRDGAAPGAPRAAIDPATFNLNPSSVFGQAAPAGEDRPRGPGGPGGPGGGRRGGMGGGGGYGNLVDAGSVVAGLIPSGNLVVFDPAGTEFKPVASYKVSEGQTHSYPVFSGNRIFIKDRDTLTLWTVD